MAEKHSTHTCEVCGNAFNRSLNKDGSIRKTKYNLCSAKCKNRVLVLRRNPNAVNRDDVRKPPCTCIWCGKAYINKRRSKTEGAKYCSRECAFKAQAIDRAERAAPKYCRVHASQCKVCSKPILSRLPRLYCGDECTRAAYSIAPSTKECNCCGNEFKPEYTGGGLSDYCSDVCRETVAASNKRVDKVRRRARLKGATIERVDPYRVFDRDRWRCKLCGTRTPKAKRGTYDDNAPELDHINPLSQGGEHSYTNTQCACRKCNGMKSSKPLGQMMMFG
jgi:hypothetical protein